MQQDAPYVRITIPRKGATPGLHCIDALYATGKAQVLNGLHDSAGTLVKAVAILVQTDNIRRVLSELDIASRGDGHCSLCIFGHLLGVDIDGAGVRFENLVFPSANS